MTTDELDLITVDEDRCRVSGNPCGTDTVQSGRTCLCEACQRWLLRRVREAEAERDRMHREALELATMHEDSEHE